MSCNNSFKIKLSSFYDFTICREKHFLRNSIIVFDFEDELVKCEVGEYGLIETEVATKKIILTHGNFDKNTNAAFRLPQLLGYVPDYIISGHIHHDVSKDFGRTMHIVNPSLVGADDYATSGRYGGRPGQKLILFEDNDIESISTIFL